MGVNLRSRSAGAPEKPVAPLGRPARFRRHPVYGEGETVFLAV
jgi:hypothetical protein